MTLQLGLRFGIIHGDEKDDEGAFSILIPLGVLPPGSHMGTFLDARSGSYIEWDGSDLGVFLFRGTDSHVGTPATLPPVYLPPPPGRVYSRSVVVGYPSRLAVQPDAPVAIDAHDLLTTRGLLRGIHPGIPFLGDQQGHASAGGSVAASVTIVAHRARQHFQIELRRRYRFRDYEGMGSLASSTGSFNREVEQMVSSHLDRLADDHGETWASVVRRQAWSIDADPTHPSIQALASRGNPFAFVARETSSLWASKSKRDEKLARADDYFQIAADSVVSGRTMVQAARSSERGVVFAWRQAWARPILATNPAPLRQYLEEQQCPLSAAQVIATAVANNLSTAHLEVSLGDWTRDLTRAPELPVPPLSAHEHLFRPSLLARRNNDSVEWTRYAGSVPRDRSDLPVISLNMPVDATPSWDTALCPPLPSAATPLFQLEVTNKSTAAAVELAHAQEGSAASPITISTARRSVYGRLSSTTAIALARAGAEAGDVVVATPNSKPRPKRSGDAAENTDRSVAAKKVKACASR